MARPGDRAGAGGGAVLRPGSAGLGAGPGPARTARRTTRSIGPGPGRKDIRDLLAIADAADADRDMTALTLAVGPSGMKRLRAAWALADSLSDRTRPLPSSPVEAARALVPAAVETADTLTAVKTLLG